MFKAALVFLAVAAFCYVFNYIYAQHSHGVHSAYMTYMYAYPLLGGTLVYALIGILPGARAPGRLAANAWHSGIAALTVGSMLRGIFDIAGTESGFQPVFMLAGILMVCAGAACYVAGQFDISNRTL